MRQRWVPLVFVAAAYLLLAFVLLHARPASPYEEKSSGPPPASRQVEGVWFDDGHWSAVFMPDSAVACRWEGTTLRCIPIPPGSILLIPQAR